MIGKYAQAFSFLVAQPKWVCRGDADVYTNYEWCDDRPQPTQAECDAVIPTLLAQLAHDAIREQRHQAFIVEADPLFFAWQRGEATEEEWLAKCAEIRARFPYVDVEQ
jgi:hypothetical protein